MTHSLYTKFILGYLLFGLLGFILIATFSSQLTYRYLSARPGFRSRPHRRRRGGDLAGLPCGKLHRRL